MRWNSYVHNFFRRHLTAPRLFLISFVMIILVGTALLRFPFSASRQQLSWINAFFTATSAVCVTGLTVVDVGKDLSFTGQIITLFLFQIGGIGIITFSVVFFALMGRNISFKDREIMQSTFLHTPRRDFLAIVKWVLFWTFIIEGIGTLILFLRFHQDFPPADALYKAVYHAVSAFNNCGYSLFSDNLIRYQGDPTVNLVIMGLIVSGGLGFIVQYELITHIRSRQKKSRLSLHTKIVLITTLALIVGGAALFYLFEMNNVLKNAPLPTRILTSFFQAITPRTCGFNTVDIGLLTNDSILIIILLMYIGASPGSTGGGIKTTSFALLMIMIWNRLKGQEEVTVYNRTVPREILTRTGAIIVASAFSVLIITLALLFLGETGTIAPKGNRQSVVEYLFEAVSAFGTVGLSMGITSALNTAQKFAIILLMFIGRVGPLTLAYSWHSPRRGIVYAEEAVMVG